MVSERGRYSPRMMSMEPQPKPLQEPDLSSAYSDRDDDLDSVTPSGFDSVKAGSVGPALKKPVESLAMIPEEGGRISLVERRLYYTLMWYAQQQGWGPNQELFRVPLAQVLKKMSYGSKNLEPIRNALVSMATTSIQWQSPTLGEGATWGVSAMIAHAEIIASRSGSIIEWSYSPKVRGKVLDPFPYAKGSLEVMGLLRGYGALALYDICSRYVSSESGLTPKRHWHWWRPVLTGGSDGLGGEPQFKQFNRDVLKKAISEVNTKTSIEITVIVHKFGTRVQELQFQARRKRDFTPPLSQVKTESGLKEIGRAIGIGVAQQQAELFYQQHGEAAFANALDVMEGQDSKGAIRAPKGKRGGYLGKILETTTFEATSGELVDHQKESAAIKQKRLELLEQYRGYKREEALRLYKEKNASEQAQDLEQFELKVIAAKPSMQKTYKAKGLQIVSVMSLFKGFLAEAYFGPEWGQPTDNELLTFSMLYSVNTLNNRDMPRFS